MSDRPTNTNREEILKRTLLEIKSVRAKAAELERMRSEPIAITGMACRFPGGADSPERFWQILRDGVDTVVEVPADRWDVNEWWNPDPNVPGTMYTRSGAFLREDLSAFDAEFFRISPREADSLDPQQRLLLEVAWEALEDGGEAPGAISGAPVGVFLGISTNDYAQFTMYGDPDSIEAYTATGNALNAAAGRIAYFLGAQGPALAIDTACSLGMPKPAQRRLFDCVGGRCQSDPDPQWHHRNLPGPHDGS
jgi:acyl transferase domain-containing protein